MKGGKGLIVMDLTSLVLERGTYQELKSRNVNFSAWVTDVVQMDDDPYGLFENSILIIHLQQRKSD